MKVGLLSTDTPHHRFFVHELASRGMLSFVIFERRSYPWVAKRNGHLKENLPNLLRGIILNPYIRSKRLEAKQLALETERFRLTEKGWPPQGVQIESVHSVNDDVSAGILRERQPDLLLVYGTGVVKKDVFSLPRLGTINAHGGYLPHFRGLDTNLWAALHGHPEHMAVTLHEMDEGIDTGSIYMVRTIPAAPDLARLTLRYYTTLLCTEMMIELLLALEEGQYAKTSQDEEGAYFGPMPLAMQIRAGWIIRRFARRCHLRKG